MIKKGRRWHPFFVLKIFRAAKVIYVWYLQPFFDFAVEFYE